MTIITIYADHENNAEVFWAAFDDAFPAIADQVRSGKATVDTETWEAIQSLEGFSDGPSHAPCAILVDETTPLQSLAQLSPSAGRGSAGQPIGMRRDVRRAGRDAR